jgi:hypothetical protein
MDSRSSFDLSARLVAPDISSTSLVTPRRMV